MEKTKILVLDDERDLTFMLGTVLQFNKYEVTTTEVPCDAMEKLKQNNFDLLITDLKMEGMSGMEVIDAVRKDPKFQSLKIIMLTSCDLSEEELKKLSKLNVTYMKKPFLPNEIVQKISNLFENT